MVEGGITLVWLLKENKDLEKLIMKLNVIVYKIFPKSDS